MTGTIKRRCQWSEVLANGRVERLLSEQRGDRIGSRIERRHRDLDGHCGELHFDGHAGREREPRKGEEAHGGDRDQRSASEVMPARKASGVVDVKQAVLETREEVG